MRSDEQSHRKRKRNARRPGAGDRFEVLERIGEGTLFAVYRVRDRETGATCALKALKGKFARNSAFTNALAVAAENCLDLSHPHVAEIDEVGEEEGTLFLVNEWLPGVALEDRLRRAPFSRSETITYTRQIAHGLDYLHRHNLIHGDLRPSQILAADEGALKLTDGGLWPAFAAAGLALTDVQQDAAYYLAPECGNGLQPSRASDFYALGIILYRMTTGRVPFDGPSALSIAKRHQREQPMQPSQWNPACPADLEALVLRLLAKSPEERPTSAAEVLDALAGNSTAAVPPPRPPAVSIPAYNDFVPSAAAAAAVASAAIAADPVPGAAALRTNAGGDNDALFDEVIDEKLERKRQRRGEAFGAFRAVLWLAVAIGILSGIMYGAYAYWVAHTPPAVTVPDYRGKNRSVAEDLLAARGLKLVVSSEVYDPKRPADTVIKGDPPPGKQVRTGREILVTVSKGEEPVNMPDLTELALQRARQIIERSGMKLGQVSDQYNETVPKGYIISQFPEPSQPFHRSEPISLTVSRGPQPASDTDNNGGLGPLPTDTPPPADFDSSGASPVVNPTSPPSDLPRISRTIKIRVAIPANGTAQEVSIDVQDDGGDRTVYRGTHQPGEMVVEKVKVTRRQGTKATIRVYVDGNLLREQII